MSPPIILLILRIVSAVLLLAFLGFIAWLSYQELRVSTELYGKSRLSLGHIVVISSLTKTAPEGQKFPLTPMMSIGRSMSNSIVLEDEYVSNEHALIFLKDGKWWLEDLGSRNGTLLNDLPLNMQTMMVAGDKLTIGNTSLKLDLL